MTKEALLMTKHAQDEANDDGISRTEIAEAIARGPRVPEGKHFVTAYRHFTVVYERAPGRRFKNHHSTPGKTKKLESKIRRKQNEMHCVQCRNIQEEESSL